MIRMHVHRTTCCFTEIDINRYLIDQHPVFIKVKEWMTTTVNRKQTGKSRKERGRMGWDPPTEILDIVTREVEDQPK